MILLSTDGVDTTPIRNRRIDDGSQRISARGSPSPHSDSGELEVRIDRAWPLEEAAQAHRYLEGRRTTGKLLLVP